MIRCFVVVCTVAWIVYAAAGTLAAAPAEFVFTQQQSTARPGQSPTQLPGTLRTIPAQPVFVQPAPTSIFGIGGQQQPVQQYQQQVAPGVSGQPPQQPGAAARPTVTRATPTGTGTVMNFDNAPLHTFINQVMQILGYNYVIDPAVNGTVNLYTTHAVQPAELFSLLEYVLRLNNVTITRKEDLFLIVPEGKGVTSPHEVITTPLRRATPAGVPQEIPAGAAGPLPAPLPATAPVGGPSAALQTPPLPSALDSGDPQGYVTYIVPMHYIAASQMAELIKPFMSGGSSTVIYDPANILLISETRSNMKKVLEIITALDTNFFDLKTIDLINIRYNKVADVVKDLTKVFSGGNEQAPLGMNLVPIERLNSLLVVAHSPEVMAEVRRWIERLDAPTGGTNFQTFIYEVQNTTAANIAEIVSLLFSDGIGFPSSMTAEEGGPAGARAAGTAQGQTAQQQRQQQSIRPRESQSPRRDIRGGSLGPNISDRRISSQTAATSSLLGENVKVIVNEFNNSLVIQASEADYHYLKRTIEQLDTLPRQVLIEAKIYAVELRDDLSFGVNAFLENREQKSPATTASIEGLKAGLSAATQFRVGESRQFEAVITALRSKTNVKILQAPRILTMDGQQATLNVGADVPVTTSSFGDPVQSGQAGAFLNQIQFRQTGTTLLISPRISAAGIVTMDVAVEVSSPTGGGLTPTINRNFVETSLIVQDGQAVAIAGIITDENNLDRKRVPLLGDVPILGALFGVTSRTSRRSELIVLITPRVIRDIPTALEVTDWFRKSLKNTYEVIKDREEDERKRIEKRDRKEMKERQQELKKNRD